MLILLSDRFRGRMADLVQEHGFVEAMRNLAMAHIAGKHVVAGPTAVVVELIALLSGDVQTAWRQVKRGHPNLNELREHVAHICVVEPEAELWRESSGEQTRHHVPYSYFSDFERVGRAHLVAEHQDDAAIYEAATRAYMSLWPDLSGFEVELWSFGGGGDTMAEAARDHANHALSICVADSDKKWPEASDGPTLHKLRKACEELETKYLVALFALPCHELENLLPAALVLESLMPNDHDLHRRCESARDLGFMAATAPLHHLDLKNGLRLRDVLRAEKPAHRAFLRQVFDQHRAKVSCPEGGFCEQEEPPCKGNKERETCRCILFAGLTSKCAPRVSDFCRKRSSNDAATLTRYFFSPDLPCRDTWLSLCCQIFSFACAYPRARL